MAQQPQEKKVGSFTLIKTADKMTDEDRSRAITFGEDQKGALTWICLEDGLNVGFLWNTYLIGNDGNITVQHRFDEGPARTNDWDMATTHKLGYVPMRMVKAFTAHAESARTLTLRATDKDGDTVTDTFPLRGLTAAVAQLPCAK